jgi:hypothetical protein
MFGKLFKAVLNTAFLPVEVVKDVVTLGGTLNGEDETYTGKRLEKIQDQIDEALD